MSLTLRQKQSVFAHFLADLIQKAEDLGFEVTMGETFRSQEEAARLARAGKGIKNSLHCQRLAVDLNLFKDGLYLTDGDDYAPLGLWWEQQSGPEYECCWGGRFHDGNHFSITHGGRK